MFSYDELRDPGNLTARKLAGKGVSTKSAGRVRGCPAQAVYLKGDRVGHVRSHAKAGFSAHVRQSEGPMSTDIHHSGGHVSIAAAAAHVVAGAADVRLGA